MLKFVMMMIFMIPLSFFRNFWLNMYMYFIMSMMFMMNIGYSSLMMKISYYFMVDLLSYVMILLSFWICSLMILASSKVYLLKNYYNLFMLMMVILLICLFITFCASNLFLFYMFFEASLIPTLVLIIGWGYQPERIQAGNYLMFYTLFGSLPMLIFIFIFFLDNNSLSFSMIEFKSNNLMMFMFMNMVFLVKMPMYLVHLWLPKAHVEAPVSGSMILAGIMLKLGGYGMMRLLNIFNKIFNSFNYIIIAISLLGGVIVSLICLRQSDMKSLIAYSSVAHMGLVLGGLCTFNFLGLWGALSLMVAHGLCSSGLFCLANMSYERISSRSLFLNKGLMNLMPSLSLWWFLLCSSNMAAPPSMNLMGEILLINSLVSWSEYSMLFLMLVSFFSAAYSLYLYAYSQHGVIYSGLFSIYSSNLREFLLLFLHWVPLNIMFFKMESFMLWI